MGFHHASSLGVSTAFLLLTLTACGGDQTAAIGEPAVADTPNESKTQVATSQTGTTQASEPAKESAVEQTAQAPSDVIAQAPRARSQSYGAQTLNDAELALIESELGPSEDILREHSFALDVPDMGNVVFVTSRARREGQPNRLVMRLRDNNGEFQPLVPVNQETFSWNFEGLQAVSFEDVNGDGLGPDIVAIADYSTGAGPQAAQPFPVATVQFRDRNGFFAADPALDTQLTDQGVSTISGVRVALSNTGVSANPTAPAPTQAARKADTSYSAEKLNPAALALIESELGASEEVFSDHSFALDLPEMGGDVAFVASRAERGNKPFGDFVMRLRSPDGEYQPLVPANQLQNSAWNFWGLKAIGFEDVNGDGLGPDIIAITEYMTGAGPEAAQPFPIVTVQFREAGGFFIADAAVDDQLNSQELSTIAEVREALSQ